MKLDVKEWIKKVSSQLKEPVKTVYWTDGSRTIAANATLTREAIDISSVVPSGYKTSFASFRFAGNYQMICYSCTVDDSAHLTYQIANRLGSSATVTPQFQILCVKE